MADLPTLILAGCGYSTAEVVAAAQGHAQIIAINPEPTHVNSGMSTRVLSGRFSADLVKIPLQPFLADHDAELIQGRVISLDPETQQVMIRLATGSLCSIHYDLLLLNVGQAVVAPWAQAWTARPLSQLVAAHQHIRTCWQQASQGISTPGLLTFVVAGGGCTGVELMAELWDLCQLCSQDSGIPFCAARFILVTGSATLVPEMPKRFRDLVQDSLLSLGVELWCSTRVVAQSHLQIVINHQGCQSAIACQTLMWAGGLQVSRWLAESGLPTTSRGAVRVNTSFQVPGYDSIFAVGDCCHWQDPTGRVLPTIGVYTVRSAPVVADNIQRWLTHRPLRPFQPQATALVSVTVGKKQAVMAKGSLIWRSRFVTFLKNFFDWRYMRRWHSGSWRTFFY